MLLGGFEAGDLLAGQQCAIDGNWRMRGCEIDGTAAGRALVVDDLVKVGVLEEDALSGMNLVALVAEEAGDGDGRAFGGVLTGRLDGLRDGLRLGLSYAVLDAGIAVGRDANAEVDRTGLLDHEVKVRSHEDVADACGHADFHCAAVEGEHERRCFACWR